jgi:hypothetical protein
MTRPFEPRRRVLQAGQGGTPFSGREAGREGARDGESRTASGSERRLPVATSSVSRSEEDDARASSKYRAALEALFAPKPAAPPADVVPDRSSVKMVTVPVAREADPRHAERTKRLAKLLAAEGRAAVSKAADDYLQAGFALPEEQEVLLKLLDHTGEDRVRDALHRLLVLLDREPAQRRAVLDARVRRLEEDAEEPETRALATSVRRKVLAASSSSFRPRGH